jgi:uncharacterized membrane protein YkoI
MSNRLNQMSTPVAAVVVVVAMLGGAGIGLAAANLTDDADGERQDVVAGPPDAATDATQPTTDAPDPAASDPAPAGPQDAPVPAPGPAATPSPGGPAASESPPPQPPDASAPPGVDVIAADEAGRIAADHVGGGAVQAIEPEDDYGAAWEVEIYRADGEYEVYVNAVGTVVRALGPFPD